MAGACREKLMLSHKTTRSKSTEVVINPAGDYRGRWAGKERRGGGQPVCIVSFLSLDALLCLCWTAKQKLPKFQGWNSNVDCILPETHNPFPNWDVAYNESEDKRRLRHFRLPGDGSVVEQLSPSKAASPGGLPTER